MKKIVFATGNKDKMREIREIMADCEVEIFSMKEAGIDVDIVENGTTFEENALIKSSVLLPLRILSSFAYTKKKTRESMLFLIFFRAHVREKLRITQFGQLEKTTSWR